jgi:periplasmic divalent cation tolerance protein
MTDDIRLALCTCPDRPVAEALAAGLVEAGLAACVNIVPGLVSVYAWQGRIEKDTEVLLLIKTTAARIAALTAHITAHHPYDVPEVIVHPITDGHPNYLDWVRTCTNPDR